MGKSELPRPVSCKSDDIPSFAMAKIAQISVGLEFRQKAVLTSWVHIAGLLVCITVSGRPVRGDQPPVKESKEQGVVFVMNGAGRLQGTSAALQRVVAEAGLPLAVVTVEWSHGRLLADQTDWRHAREQGCRLADRIVSYRRSFPDRSIYLAAHSAGSGVALTAAAAVPPSSLKRIILFAPSVSAGYDVRPALRGAHEGMDVFYSRRDVFA